LPTELDLAKEVTGLKRYGANREDRERTAQMNVSLPFPEISAEVEEWLAIREEAGLQIDPATAKVCLKCGRVLDPYGVYSDLPDEYNHIRKLLFARSPGSEIWVEFWDLPEETQRGLVKMLKSRLELYTGL
jgi:hypothetical protein